jgi:hypothetical protein
MAGKRGAKRPWREVQMLRLLSDIATAISVALVAALEAAIEVQRVLPQTDVIVSTTGWVRFAPLGLLIFAGCVWLCQLALPGRRTIEILTPLEDEAVPHTREVRGSIWPPGAPLQILVFAGWEWQPQQLPTRDGASWSVQCNFEALSAEAGCCKIAAISRKVLVVGAVKRLPWWSTTRSNIVRVTRS